MLDYAGLTSFVDDAWERSIIPCLHDYIRIPNKSPLFDPDWAAHGHMDQAVQLLEGWCRAQIIDGLSVEVVRLPGKTPVLLVEVEGSGEDTVLLYGHYDKQPEFSGWVDGLSPWEPVRRDGKLYGRGGADDGYAVFGSLTAIRALQQQGIEHHRCVILIEGSEESGSPELPDYVAALRGRIGDPSLVVCLDAECGDYERLWATTSLRGNLTGTLSVDVLTEGVHSGSASGIVPSSFRILRSLLSRLEDEATGVLADAFNVEIPADRLVQTKATAELLGAGVSERFPWAANTGPVVTDAYEMLLNGTWRPTLSVTGADGLPAAKDAGNTLRPGTAVKLSFRLPPTLDADEASSQVKQILEVEPPYGARVHFEADAAAAGWNAPAVAPWLERSMDAASEAFFGPPAAYMGTGGTIPFMDMLGKAFPGVQFLITGVLGPQSNAHGPNEFLHLATGKRVTACVSQVLADHFKR
jgi:acetylornithine deacetylase/succinyl-diaminopimelate desuccinylase-like protein